MLIVYGSTFLVFGMYTTIFMKKLKTTFLFNEKIIDVYIYL